MSTSSNNLDYYCFKCDSYFILSNIENPSCIFCHDSFVISSKERKMMEPENDDYDEYENELHKVNRFSKSRNERYIIRHVQENNPRNNLLNLGNNIYMTRNTNINRLFLTTDSQSSLIKHITNEQIDSFPTIDTSNCINYDASCSICFCEFSESIDVIKMLHCGHQFHKTCLQKWLTQKQECPVCRHAVTFQTSTKPNRDNEKRSFSSVVNNGI